MDKRTNASQCVTFSIPIIHNVCRTTIRLKKLNLQVTCRDLVKYFFRGLPSFPELTNMCLTIASAKSVDDAAVDRSSAFPYEFFELFPILEKFEFFIERKIEDLGGAKFLDAFVGALPDSLRDVHWCSISGGGEGCVERMRKVLECFHARYATTMDAITFDTTVSVCCAFWVEIASVL